MRIIGLIPSGAALAAALAPPVALGAFALFASSGTAEAQTRWHCGCSAHVGGSQASNDLPTDCDYSSNTPSSAYDPTTIYEIPVVVHVIMNSSGSGALSNQDIIDQIARLNEDYSGATLGMGSDSGIRFRLATSDPAGAATNGITRSTDDTWFQDQGNYPAALAWDTSRYLNLYTLSPMFGALGYVPDIPQGGLVGTPEDRVVMSFMAINNPMFEMVVAHEVGHYLGLYHTFGMGNSCANANCNDEGDLMCDTNPHRTPTQSCGGGASSCGSPEPDHNYMNYLSVSCMYEFTPEQIQRMRCTLENWRPTLARAGTLGVRYCQGTPNSTGLIGSIRAAGSLLASDNSLTLSASNLPAGQFGIFLTSMTQGFSPGASGTSNGNICLGGTVGRYNRAGQILSSGMGGEISLALDLTMTPQGGAFTSVSSGQTWNFQGWHRDGVGLGSNFTEGLEIQFQ